MDVSFSNVLEGTRQYFQGLPKATSDEGDDKPSTPTPPATDGARPPDGDRDGDRDRDVNGGGSTGGSRPPSVAVAVAPGVAEVAASKTPEPPRPPSEPLLEPEPHFIHKATVMRQANRQREAFLNPADDLERPPSIHLISPPTHIIPKPPHTMQSQAAPQNAPPRDAPAPPPQRRPPDADAAAAAAAAAETPAAPTAAAYRASHVPTPPQPTVRDVLAYRQRTQPQPRAPPAAQPPPQAAAPYRRSYPDLDARYLARPVSQAPHPRPVEAYPRYSYPAPSAGPPSGPKLPAQQQQQQRMPPYKISAPTYSPQPARDSSAHRAQQNFHQPPLIPQNSRVPPIVPHVVPHAASHVAPQRSPQPPHRNPYAPNPQHQQRGHCGYDEAKSDSRDYTYSVHRAAAAQAVQHNRAVAAAYSDARYRSGASHAPYAGAPPPQGAPARAPQPSALRQREYRPAPPPAPPPAPALDERPAEAAPYGYPAPGAPSPQYAHHSGGSSGQYQQPPYRQAPAAKPAYDVSVKHAQSSKAPANKANCPPQRMTVSVQSIVNQMNVMRKQQTTKRETAPNNLNQKKESPLDLSVKTVKIPADSTGQDDAENMTYEKRDAVQNRKHHILSLREPSVVSYAQSVHTTTANASHKVDFLPNFSSPYPETPRYDQSLMPVSYHPDYPNPLNTHNRNKPVYPESNVHNHPNYQSNVIKPNYMTQKRIDSGLPRIDLTASMGKDYNKEHVNGSQSMYVREDTRKRYPSHPTNNIPEKIVRYETWSSNSRIEKHNINKEVNHIHQQTKIINGKHYDYNQFKHLETVKAEEYPKNPYHCTPYPQVHPVQYPGQYSADMYKYAPRENGSRYLPEKQQHYMHKQNMASKIPTAMETVDNLNSGSPADKRVLSILRNSLEVKSGIESSRVVHALDEPIVIDHDDSEPELNNMATVKETEAPSSKADPVSRKLHMPKAVDSFRFDSDSKSSYFDDVQNDNSKNSDDHSSFTNISPDKCTSEMDVAAVLAARIRTKAELKGFTLPQQKNAAAEDNTNKGVIVMNNVITNQTESTHTEAGRIKLISKDKIEEIKTENNNLVKVNDTSVFDFEDSQPEVDSENKQTDSREIIKNETEIRVKEEPKTAPEVNENPVEEAKEPEDPFWAESCDHFMEQLKTGINKKKARKKKAEPELLPEAVAPAVADLPVSDPLNDYRIDKSVVVNVVDIIKSDNSDIPYIMKIKEEFKEMENIKVEPESTDDDEPLIRSVQQKNKLNCIESNLTTTCPAIKIKTEPADECELPLEAESVKPIKPKTKNKSKSKSDDSDDKGNKRKRQTETTSEDSDSDDNLVVGNRLRPRKATSTNKCDENKNKVAKDTPKKKDDKNLLKKPGFGDGSDFRPGWEEEVYRYKRSLRMPSRLINVPSPLWPRISSSLPDLDPSSPATSSSTTDDIYIRPKYATSGCDITDKCKDMDSDMESNFSYSVNQKVGYDSEASCSTVFSFVSKTARKKDNGPSILDLLIQKCGKKDEPVKKQKEDHFKPKVIPKSTNALELLETPSLHDDNKTKSKSSTPKKEKIREDLFYSFRKETVSTFRDHFISDADGPEFSPVVLKSRTRTETRVLKQRETIREVFGDERPASAPPSSCLNEEQIEEVKIDEAKPKLPLLKKVIKNKKSIREGLRSSRILRRSDSKGVLRHKRNNILKSFKNKKIKMALNNVKVKIEPDRDATENTKVLKEGEEPTTSPSNKKRFRRLFTRRKFSSGFDYIRKKKKIIKREEDTPKLIRKPIAKAMPESVHDIQKEIKGWIINKGIGETALHRAARLGYTDCVAYCLEKMDLPPSAKDNAGYTALHEASSRGHLQIAKILLQYGANVSEAAQGGIRPLHEACENEHIEIVRLLLSYGADPLLATYGGQTPLSLAEGETAKYLSAHIADLQGTSAEPWHFAGPSKIFDLAESGCDALLTPPPPSPSPPPPSPPLEICASPAPLPPLYSLRPSRARPLPPGPWCLLHDLSAALQVKSREALLKQIHCGPGSPRESLCELRTAEFLERAVCHQLLAAGERVNLRASKVCLVKFTAKVSHLLSVETTLLS